MVMPGVAEDVETLGRALGEGSSRGPESSAGEAPSQSIGQPSPVPAGEASVMTASVGEVARGKAPIPPEVVFERCYVARHPQTRTPYASCFTHRQGT